MSQAAVVVLLRWLFALLAVVLLIVLVVRPVLRMLRQKPEVDLLTPDFSHVLEGEELEIPAQPEDKGYDRTDAIRQARSDPRATAMFVQRWLRERK